MNTWVAPKGTRLPDFIICGAMKCGTTTVHSLLNSHPHISIPEEEVHFYDIDDQLEHGDFVFRAQSDWIFPDVDANPLAYWQWYSNFFENFPADNLIGEDSTGYLASEKALERISLQKKTTKIIICLRSPTDRAYSHYSHLLRSGRALFNFEDTICYTPHYVLKRSLYLKQIRRLLSYIPREQVFFFILEDFVADKVSVVQSLTSFLDVSFEDLPKTWPDTHSNKGGMPRFPTLQILKNKLSRQAVDNRYINHLPISDYSRTGRSRPHIDLRTRVVNKIHNTVNPFIDTKPPKMKPETRVYLDQYFKRELSGLNELIGTEVLEKWFKE